MRFVTKAGSRFRHVGRAGACSLLLALSVPGCGLLSDSETNPNGDPPVVLRARHLPELLRFVELGATTPERVQAEFRGQHLYVVSSVGRELRVTELGANTGRPYAAVTVTRRAEGGVPIGQLGDEFTLTFEFTSFEPDGEGPLRLFGVQVSQPLGAPDVCLPARELAAREGLAGCHEESMYSAGAPTAEGYFHACVYDEDDLPVEVRCAPSPAGDTRLFTVTATLGREGELPEPLSPSEATTPVAAVSPPVELGEPASTTLTGAPEREPIEPAAPAGAEATAAPAEPAQ